jgi:trigger factor
MASELLKKDKGVYDVKTATTKDEWKIYEDKALKKLAGKVNVKGFRKGQAPLELAKEHISPQDLVNEAINYALNPLYQTVLKEHKLVPYIQPDVKVDGLDENGVKVTFTITTRPEVTLGTYKGIALPLAEAKVTAKDIDEAIEGLLKDNAELVLKDGPIAKGDTVVLDFKGYIDGKEFDGGSADNYSLVIGSNSFVPGFEDQLIGATAESKRDVEIVFPEQYIESLAGKKAKFACMIHEIKEKKNPELTDDFAASLNLPDVKTVADLKKYEEKTLLENKKKQVAKDHFLAVLDKIIEGSTIEIADAVITSSAEDLKKNLVDQIAQNGITYEQYKEITGMTEEKIMEQFKEQALRDLKKTLILEEIGKKENLFVSKDEVEGYYKTLAKSYNRDVEDIKKLIKSYNQEGEVAVNLEQRKIENFISANNPPLVETKEEAKKAPVKKEKSQGTTEKKD